jgi:subtilisin family serine protease
MDGETAPISIGAGIACNKGIIVVNSAGNSGNSSWHYIGAPADNFDVLSVGAVDENEEFASFSSYGPNADGAVKPNVVAQGKNTVIISSSDTVRTGNGTSFSSPITAGMVACLWGANPDKSTIEIKDAIYKSADRYLLPDTQFGYGIPDYFEAFMSFFDDFDFEIFDNDFYFTSNKEVEVNYAIYTIDGKYISKGKFYSPFYWEDVQPKAQGMYIVNFRFLERGFSKKFIVSE